MSSSIFHQRLYQQGITRRGFTSPVEVVAWLGAVQSQDYPGAKWSMGMRIDNSIESAMDQVFNDGSILRTHVMRPTWHFVTPADIHWMLELTAPRVIAKLAYYERELELDEPLYTRCNAVFERVLQGGKYLTRPELGKALQSTGIDADGRRLGHILVRSELDGVLCSGPRRGKQFTYALLAERAPQAITLTRDEALAELTRRYFTGHGPATPRDFAWWSGLTIADAKTGIDMLGAELAQAEIDGQAYWFSAVHPPVNQPSSAAHLMPTFDEFLVGYDGYDKIRRGGGVVPQGGNPFLAALLMGGQVAGSWRRTLQKDGVIIELMPFSPLTPEQCQLVEAAARQYGQFLGMPVAEITGLA